MYEYQLLTQSFKIRQMNNDHTDQLLVAHALFKHASFENTIISKSLILNGI